MYQELKSDNILCRICALIFQGVEKVDVMEFLNIRKAAPVTEKR